MRHRTPLILLALALVLLGAIGLRLCVGSTGLGIPASGVILELRASRALAGGIVGVCLAVGGVLLQALLRNPLASPGIIGLSSGASLAVVAFIYLGWATTGQPQVYLASAWHALPALAGGMATLALVWSLARRRGSVDPTALILIGVIVSILCGAITNLLQHLMPVRPDLMMRALVGWISDDTPWYALTLGGAAALAGVIVGVRLGPAMDAASLGDDEAHSVGVDLDRHRAVLFITAGLATAGAVVIAGPIGFVGLVCPHVVRLLAGPAHRPLVIGAACLGGAMIIGGDAVTRLARTPGGSLPLGVVTALVGGPVFIWLLRRERVSTA